MDLGKIIARVKALLITPKTEWPITAAEPATVSSLYAGYIAIVAALPAIAGFVKGSLIGTTVFGITVRTPVAMGLVGMLLSYLLGLVLVYVMALIINTLAPTFNGQKDLVQALKTVAYAWTASWIAGMVVIVPWLGWLVAIAGGIYSIYLLYLGLPHTMKCPPEKAGGYAAVSIVIAIVLSWIIGLVVAGVIGTTALSGAAMSGMHISDADGGDSVTVDDDSALGKLTAMGRRAEQASKDMDAAQKSGDTHAQSVAMGKMMGAMAGADGPVEALAPGQIKTFLPEMLGDLKRSSISAQRNQAVGMQVSEATADYGSDNQRITLEVTDTGGAKGLMAMAAAMVPEEEKETDHGYEKTYSADGHMIHEEWNTRSRSGEYSVVIGKRFTVKAHGNVDSIEQLKRAVASVDLGKLESLKNTGVKSD